MYFSSVKEINRLISKECQIQVTICEKLTCSKLRFLSLTASSPGQFLGTPTHVDIIEFSNFLLQLKNQRSGSKTLVCGFSVILILKGVKAF